MNSQKSSALRMRLKGKSYAEIGKELGLSKSTLSNWFKNIVLSDDARARLAARSNIGTAVMIKRNKMQTHTALQRARVSRGEGAALINALTPHDLLLIGAALYWAEGYKRLQVRGGKERTAHAIRFVNSDPLMIKAFIRFLRESFQVPTDKIRASMRLYPSINEYAAREYWILTTGLPASCFERTTTQISISSLRKRPFNRLPYGTLQIEVRNTPQFHRLLGLIEGVQKRLEP